MRTEHPPTAGLFEVREGVAFDIHATPADPSIRHYIGLMVLIPLRTARRESGLPRFRLGKAVVSIDHGPIIRM